MLRNALHLLRLRGGVIVKLRSVIPAKAVIMFFNSCDYAALIVSTC